MEKKIITINLQPVKDFLNGLVVVRLAKSIGVALKAIVAAIKECGKKIADAVRNIKA